MIDFKAEFEKFNINMERTRRSMEDYIQNSLFLVELETDVQLK